MLSSSTDKSKEKEQRSSSESPKNISNSVESCDKGNQSTGSPKDVRGIVSYGQQRRNLAHFLFICLILIGSSIHCGESAPRGKDNSPCICKRHFYKSCPDSCRNPPTSSYPTLGQGDHGFDHPDHNEELMRANALDDFPFNPSPKGRLDSSMTSTKHTDDGESILRHRKVYVSEKQLEEEPIIHPLKVTIPIMMDDDPSVLIPPPKPIFKMRKYTTYETKPEIEMVPVTTTIIKPVGVTKDQFIDYKKP